MKHTEQMTTKTLVAALLAAGMFPSVAHAADIDYVKVNDNGELNRSTEAAARYSVAIGIQTTAEGLSSVAIGSDTAANGGSAVALGALSDAQGIAATALGQGTQATANAATAVGRQAAASGNGSTAVGSVSAASASAATAFGSGSMASANNATALGQGAQASGSNSVAAGQKAAASEVAATAIGSGAVASGKYATATGAAATASGVASVASGLQSKAEGGSSVAIGRGAVAAEDYSVALGTASKTEAAVGTTEATVNGVTYSGFAGTAPAATVSVGAADFERTITNVAAGRIEATSTDAINGSQLYLMTNNLQNKVNAANSKVAAGANIVVTPETSPTDGSTTYTVSTKPDLVVGSVTAGNTVLNNEGVTINNGAAGSPVTLTQSGLNNGGNVITNVAAGTNPTDAVNVRQLNSAKTEVVAGDNITINKTTGANGQDVYKISANTAAWDNRINNRINDMEKDLRAGIAGATAMAFLQRPNEAGKSLVSAAVGGFRDQQALAIGYARNSDNNKWFIKAGVGVNTQKDVNWGGSVGYQW
ncbi:YadA family autotransporter adhesin [Neisseria yangbaofengii]|uniref:YadA family autotransporter adhesin n=1 Tax=Neisseria yangbaofengii TaxID=2709396 RepID=UPI0013EB9DC8|nr:YadA-like family protein [Neisseria yangbaofengii]